jgi:predicted SAM-dependent methyltransferase
MPEIPQLDIHPMYGREVLESKGIKRMILRFLPRHTFMHVRSEVPLILLRLKAGSVRKRYKDLDNLFVNIGAGVYGKPGWVNVDIAQVENVNCLYDCRKNLPFSDASVKGIFCEHFFEHVDYTEEVPYFLVECHRVLKKDGVLRLIVPDAELYLRAYCRGGWEELHRIRPLDANHTDFYFHCRYNTPMELLNVVFRQGHEHRFAYDFDTLRFVLSRYGFSEIVRQECGRSLNSELCLDQANRASESLYVDARK